MRLPSWACAMLTPRRTCVYCLVAVLRAHPTWRRACIFTTLPNKKAPPARRGFLGGRQHNLRRDNAHRLALQSTFNAEGHLAVNLGEQRVILAHADILARVHLGAALTDDNAAGGNQLLAKSLDAQTHAGENVGM